jgi:DNA helicase-2/ATP-dependent DNA helicase PcrA
MVMSFAATRRYLIDLFSARELQIGIFTAVGAVHRSDSDDKIPRYIPHYWPAYDPDLSAVEPRPRTFLQYVAVGRRLTRASGEVHHAVEKIADGVLRLASILNPLADLSGRKRKHRCIRELLFKQPETDQIYLGIVTALIAGDAGPAPEEWAQKWAPQILQVASAIAGTSETSDEAADFLALKMTGSTGQQQSSASQRDNVFRFPPESPKVQVRVGSIHSIKGETHTATLVVDTFYKKHNLTTLKPWLTGMNSGKGSEKTENIARLKQHYVGMTRPSHLLCLAMREDSILDGDLLKLKAQRWRIGRITDTGFVWL